MGAYDDIELDHSLVIKGGIYKDKILKPQKMVFCSHKDLYRGPYMLMPPSEGMYLAKYTRYKKDFPE